MGKRLSVRRIKKDRPYTYEDAAYELGRSIHTVRSWRDMGLPVMVETRPHLIIGEDLINFIQSRRKPRVKPAPDQFRCCKCQRLTRPLDGIAFYTAKTPARGQLEAFCEVCERACFKWAGEKSLASLGRVLEIVRNNAGKAHDRGC